MKFFTLLVSVSFLAVGSAFPIWLPLPQNNYPHLAQTPLPVPQPGSKEALDSHLISFVSTPIVASISGILVETYFYEGQYVRRGQVLAKLKVRGTNPTAYLNAPHDGVLSGARVPVGELLTAQTPLATITDQTRPHLRLHANPTANPLHAGDSIQVQLANNAFPVRGKILRWNAPTNAAPELTLQLRKSVAGATVGSALTLAPATPTTSRKRPAVAYKASSTAKRKHIYSLAVAQD